MEETVNIRRPEKKEDPATEPLTEVKALCWLIIGLLIAINSILWYIIVDVATDCVCW